MSGEWLKIGDFAREVGCTPANIYRYIKAYPVELGEEVKETGRFKMISPAGQDFIRDQMYPKTMSESATADEINKLRGLLSMADHRAAELAQQLATAQGERDRALLDSAESQKLLLAAADEKAAQEAALAAEKTRADTAEQKAAQTAQEAAEAAAGAAKIIQDLQEALAQEYAAKAEAIARADAMAKRGLIARILNRKV